MPTSPRSLLGSGWSRTDELKRVNDDLGSTETCNITHRPGNENGLVEPPALSLHGLCCIEGIDSTFDEDYFSQATTVAYSMGKAQ